MGKIKEKATKFYEENKAIISYSAGVIVASATFYVVFIKGTKRTPGIVINNRVFKKVMNPEFPLDMPVPEIKAALRAKGVTDMMDALITRSNGVDKFYIRNPID